MNGRIGRLGFTIGYFSIALVVFYNQAIAASVLPRVSPPNAQIVLALLLFVAACWLTTLRCHDYGETFWSNFWTEQIPVIGQAWALAELFFKAGDTQPNKFGKPPLF